MILSIFTLALSFPLALTRHDEYVNFRNRRTLLIPPGVGVGVGVGTSQEKKNAPFVIRVPNTSKSLFTHSVAWKAKRKQASVKSSDQPMATDDADVQVTQFHSQDSDGQVIFGFNSPDQMRIETRNADGAVHGTYSYLDPYGQVIKRQYWDTGAGFHVTGNTYPLAGSAQTKQQPQGSPYTAEVQAARDSHFQLYQQALASLLPTAKVPTAAAAAANVAVRLVPNVDVAEKQKNTSVADVSSSWNDHQQSRPNSNTSNYTYISNPATSDNDNDLSLSVNVLEPNVANGTILIQNPEYLRISWKTENKRYRINLYNETTTTVHHPLATVSNSSDVLSSTSTTIL